MGLFEKMKNKRNYQIPKEEMIVLKATFVV